MEGSSNQAYEQQAARWGLRGMGGERVHVEKLRVCAIFKTKEAVVEDHQYEYGTLS